MNMRRQWRDAERAAESLGDNDRRTLLLLARLPLLPVEVIEQLYGLRGSASIYRGPDLLTGLAGLPHLLATYRLLAALAGSRPGRPDLLAWERPWRRRYRRPTAKADVTVGLRAYAALAWDDEAAEYLLVPDLGLVTE